MAAVASDKPIAFNLHHVIGCDAFLEKCKQSYPIGPNTYCIILKIDDIEYYCTIRIKPSHSRSNNSSKHNHFILTFMNTDVCADDAMENIMNKTNKTIFMRLTAYDNIGQKSFLLTQVDFKTLSDPNNRKTPLTKLQTLIYLRCLFYRMVGITYYFINDQADGRCNAKPNRDYKLFVYRLYNVNEDDQQFTFNIEKISIYYYFFNSIIYLFPDKITENTSISDVSTLIRTNLARLPVDSDIRADFERMRASPYTIDGISIIDYIKRLKRDAPDCNEIAKKMSRIYLHLYTHYPIFSILTYFYVNNKDCIYYPKSMRSIKNHSIKHSVSARSLTTKKHRHSASIQKLTTMKHSTKKRRHSASI
jgi:hypothetical protein